jgi:hypothetical protein
MQSAARSPVPHAVIHAKEDSPPARQSPSHANVIDALRDPSRQRIRCPACGWVPDGKPHWECELCLTRFDTFKTRAHCPQCPNSWHLTECILCWEHSPHEDWYADEADDSEA